MKYFRLLTLLVLMMFNVSGIGAETFSRFAVGLTGTYYEPDAGDLKQLADDRLMTGAKARLSLGNDWAVQARYGDWDCEKNGPLYSFLVNGKNSLTIQTAGGELLYFFSRSRDLHSYLGIGAAQYKTTLDYQDNNINFKIGDTFTGYTLCIGGDLRLYRNLFLNAEMLYTHADNVVELLTITGSNYTFKVHGIMATVGLLVHF